MIKAGHPHDICSRGANRQDRAFWGCRPGFLQWVTQVVVAFVGAHLWRQCTATFRMEEAGVFIGLFWDVFEMIEDTLDKGKLFANSAGTLYERWAKGSP